MWMWMIVLVLLNIFLTGSHVFDDKIDFNYEYKQSAFPRSLQPILFVGKSIYDKG